ncbi:ESX secretion-associated protein EspG [Nocardia cyriacigeorgica]|uniref:ESX secretion-associated protein EspG n=1 Tax=Nocardia cyriacigeorgica TaxID=135487 RepID=A0A5R8PL14_9NOCA|nr:ESX secretion-associated protein EspG [Nocardia cyriacigeorgica]TLG17944.1 ESX secretion-associated protein EspG [Nocardia cyriacigeorgica]
MTEWTWDPDDFAVLWYRNGIDRFPRPLHYRSKYKTVAPFDAHAARVRDRLDRDERELIELAFHTLTESDLRIQILGSSTRTDRGGVREYRIVGARAGQHGMVLAQAAIDGVDGPIRGRLFRAEQLPARLVGLLPPCDPGRAEPGTFHVRDLEDREQEFTYRGPREQYERVALRPADGGGNAGLLVGSILDSPAPWFAMQWYDITGDGRYLEHRTREHISVRPATGQGIAACFGEWIDKALARIHDEEAERW